MELQKKELKVVYDHAKSFYKKAFYTEEERNDCKIVKLYSYNTEVLTIIVNLQDKSKSYYICNEYTAYSPTTLRHVKELLHQTFTRQVNVYDILEYVGMTKNNIIKFTRYNKPLQIYLDSKQVKE
jgi:hypothetical protein